MWAFSYGVMWALFLSFLPKSNCIIDIDFGNSTQIISIKSTLLYVWINSYNDVLSQAGRNTLVKSIVSFLPVYNMSVLQLPSKTLDSLDKMMRKFWSGDRVDKTKFHTIKWSELCKPIEEGGLGIRESKENNISLLAKTVWTCITNENLLCTNIIKDKYYPNKSLWEANFNSGNLSFGEVL